MKIIHYSLRLTNPYPLSNNEKIISNTSKLRNILQNISTSEINFMAIKTKTVQETITAKKRLRQDDNAL